MSRSVSKENPSFSREIRTIPKRNIAKRVKSGFQQIADAKDTVERYRRVRMWGVVDSFGYPSGEDIKWLETDSRSDSIQEIIADAEEKIGRPFSEETKQLFIQSIRDMWYRDDQLDELLAQGEIGLAEFNAGFARASMINTQEEAQILSDDEYAATHSQSKEDSVFLTDPSAYDPNILLDVEKYIGPQEDALPEKDAEFFWRFQPVQLEHPEIRTLHDLYPFVSERSVDAMMAADREFMRTQDELMRKSRSGAITDEEYRSAMDEARKKVEEDTKAPLTESEREYLFGKEE